MKRTDQVREHAKDHELIRADFLDATGTFAPRPDKIREVHLYFIDGRKFMLTRDEFKTLEDVHFKLRPGQDNA